MGIPLSFGILFNEKFAQWNLSSTYMAWVYNLFIFTFYMSGIFSGSLCDVFSYRSVAFVGGIVTAICFWVIIFAKGPILIVIFFSIIMGKN